MLTPSNKADRLWAMFDSYCKTVMRNASKNFKRTQANRQKYVIVGNEQIQYILDLQGHDDTYPSDVLIHAGKFSCVVSNEMLYKVMLSLPKQQRMVLILDFWYGWSDEKIARYMKISARTVYNLRQRAFKTIRTFFEQERNDT